MAQQGILSLAIKDRQALYRSYMPFVQGGGLFVPSTKKNLPPNSNTRTTTMLSWALTFLVIALIAAVLGFGGVAGTAAWIAKVLFVVFLIAFLIAVVSGRRTPV